MTITRKGEYQRILQSFEVLSVPTRLRKAILEALDSTKWDWFKECDGCTGVSEVYWPTKYFPPCLRHDYDCAMHQAGWKQCRLFYQLQRAYGMSRTRAGIRSSAVTVWWYLWRKWTGRPPATEDRHHAH